MKNIFIFLPMMGFVFVLGLWVSEKWRKPCAACPPQTIYTQHVGKQKNKGEGTATWDNSLPFDSLPVKKSRKKKR